MYITILIDVVQHSDFSLFADDNTLFKITLNEKDIVFLKKRYRFNVFWTLNALL